MHHGEKNIARAVIALSLAACCLGFWGCGGDDSAKSGDETTAAVSIGTIPEVTDDETVVTNEKGETVMSGTTDTVKTDESGMTIVLPEDVFESGTAAETKSDKTSAVKTEPVQTTTTAATTAATTTTATATEPLIKPLPDGGIELPDDIW